jgi:hypothetical protein
MKISGLCWTLLFAMGLSLWAAADEAQPSMGKFKDRQLSQTEQEVVPLAEAMPADKYDFAPTQGEFKGVRTFAQQMRHIATVNYEFAAAVLGEKNPVELGKAENGSDSLKTKDAIVKYLKDSFVLGHRAMSSLTDKNYMELIPSPEGKRKLPRGYFADVLVWHTYDHYGQAVVYARMNGVIPPASKQ